MQKWEYLVVACTGGNPRFNPTVDRVNGKEIDVKIGFDDYLQELGKEGWELAVNRGDVYYFKRPV